MTDVNDTDLAYYYSNLESKQNLPQSLISEGDDDKETVVHINFM